MRYWTGGGGWDMEHTGAYRVISGNKLVSPGQIHAMLCVGHGSLPAKHMVVEYVGSLMSFSWRYVT